MSTVPFLGRLRQWYAAEEATYGAVVSLASTDAVRILDAEMPWNPVDRKPAPDKLLTPDLQRRVTNRMIASANVKKALLWPSGTIGVKPELDIFFKNLFGTKTVGTLSTTVASAAAVGGATLTTSVGLAVGEFVGINVTGDQYRAVKILTNNTGTGAVTWAPSLPTAPTAGDTVKAGVTYTMATNPAKSIVLADYLQVAAGSAPQAFKREQRGFVVDQMVFTFDANQESFVAFTGPAQQQINPAQNQPGAFTTVGADLPSGLFGGLIVDGANYVIQKCVITITNKMVTRRGEFGTNAATNFYRQQQRMVQWAIDTYVEDPSPIYTPSLTSTKQAVLIQNGITEGKTWAMYSPATEFDVPTTPDGTNELMWQFKSLSLGSGLGNNEVSFAAL